MYGYSRTHRNYLAALAGLCFALFSVSSVAQQLPPGQGVSVDWSPTTSHWQTNGSTFRTPPGVTTSSSTAVGPVTRLPNGGAAQPMGSGITITSLERTAPLSSILRTGPAALGSAVVRCFANPLCTLGVTTATIGLQELLDRVDWSIEENGDIREEVETEVPPIEGTGWHIIDGRTRCTYDGDGIVHDSPHEAGKHMGGCFDPPRLSVSCWRLSNTQFRCEIGDFPYTSRILVQTPGISCPSGAFYRESTGSCILTDWVLVPPADISDQVDQHYNFHPSDWPVIGPHIPLESADVEIEITNAPTLITPPETTTVYDDNGQPHTITETNIDYSFTPRPGTNPGPRPAIDLETTETTTTYNPDGTSTGSSTTTTTRPAGDSTPASDPSMKIEFPGFCEWAPKLCGWLDWTQDGWDQEEPELPQIIDFEPEGDFQVGGPGDCPAPYTLNLGWKLNQTIEVSYQPFCDLGVLIKPLFLAFCYLFAGVITVRSI